MQRKNHKTIQLKTKQRNLKRLIKKFLNNNLTSLISFFNNYITVELKNFKNIKNVFGKTALDMANENKNEKIIKLLTQ